MSKWKRSGKKPKHARGRLASKTNHGTKQPTELRRFHVNKYHG